MTAAILISIIGMTGILLVGTTGVITMAVISILVLGRTNLAQMGLETPPIMFFIMVLPLAWIIIRSWFLMDGSLSPREFRQFTSYFFLTSYKREIPKL